MPGFNVGFLIFPGMTQLDFTGPFEVLSRLGTPPSVDAASRFADAPVHVVAKTLHPVVSDRGLAILPSSAFETCPPLDLICVPGGAGVADAVADNETVGFIRREGSRATFVTSVCTGAFLLGAAGLLQGRRATTHWAYLDLLHLVGARHEKARVVRDGNVFTAGGVTSGIDFAFHMVAELAGADVAKAIQLGIEYDPAPPFDGGLPDRASEPAKRLMVRRNAAAHARIREELGKLRLPPV
ncbi:MAG: DJ-1/PfpI family protein [Amaricoccus sp.]